MRTCQRNGWTLGEWAALSEHEQMEWLAWDLYRQNAIDDIFHTWKQSENGITDAAGLLMLMLESL